MPSKKHKKYKTKISFVGKSAEEVTGSAYLIKYKDDDILLDFGIYQHANKKKSYQINNRNLNKIRPKKLKAIIISHFHLDHVGNLPTLFRKGCSAKIYIPKHMTPFFKIMFDDSLKIIQSEADYLSKREGKKVKPLYTSKDVERVLDNMVECDSETLVRVSDYMSFTYYPNYHILHSMQVKLFIKDNNYNKSILYTGDLGNTSIDNKPFVSKLCKVESCDIVIGETTYAMKTNPCNQKIRDKDKEKMKVCVRETCIEDKSTILFGGFAMQRAQEILALLYNIYGQDSSFNIPIILDSPLAVKLTRLFHNRDLLSEKDYNMIDGILKWKNVILVSEWKDSLYWQGYNEPKIVISASGFLDNGRIRAWLEHLLPNRKARLITVGYSSPESLGGILKSGKFKEVEIDGKKVKNKCRITSLNSFSSHMQHNELLEYYSDIKCKEMYLCHGDFDNKIKFAGLLKEKCKEKLKSTNIYVGSKNLEIEI